jgi:hypothetical protein
MYVTTREQRKAMHDLYTRNPDGSPSYRHFRKRFVPQFSGYIAILNWCFMYVGIERDGFTHT